MPNQGNTGDEEEIKAKLGSAATATFDMWAFALS